MPVGRADRHGRPFTQLPLDYYAPGAQFFYARSTWNPDAMVITCSSASPTAGGPRALRLGVVPDGAQEPLAVRETVSYAEEIPGWNNGPAATPSTGSATTSSCSRGSGPRAVPTGKPKALRLESRPTHTYTAVDLSAAYRTNQPRKLVREFLFVRPLETMLVLDRTQAASASTVRTFVMHSETAAPTISPGAALITNGDQALQ